MANAIVESYRGHDLINLRDVFLRERRIFLSGEVDDENCDELIKQLLFMELQDNTKPVTLFINSPGGSVQAGLSVYDTLRIMKSPIRTVCVGMAASMGAIIYLAGDEGERYMLPHSKVMIHDPAYGRKDISYRKPHEIQTELDDLNKCREKLAKIIAERTGHSVEEIYEVTKNDSYFDVEEAVEYGLASKEISDLLILA